jgi:hypothetical protein
MLASAFISHRSAGRLRLRIAEKRKDTVYFSQLQGKLQKLDKRLRVDVNPLTGSVLIEHPTDLSEIMLQVETLGLFECVKDSLSTPQRQDPGLADFMRRPWVVKALLGLGTLQLFRGQPFAPTSSLFMDAYRLWLAHHPDK